VASLVAVFGAAVFRAIILVVVDGANTVCHCLPSQIIVTGNIPGAEQQPIYRHCHYVPDQVKQHHKGRGQPIQA
jgi:hypothetical protein